MRAAIKKGEAKMGEKVNFLLQEVDKKYIAKGKCPICKKEEAMGIMTPLGVLYMFCPICKKIFAGVPNRIQN